MVFETIDKLDREEKPQDVSDEGVRIQASNLCDEVNSPQISVMLQASNVNEMREEFAAFSVEGAQGLVEELEVIVNDWEAESARAEEEARKEKHKTESLEAAMECGICLAVLRNPQILNCGHSACYECLKSWWIRPIDGSEDPTVSTNDEDNENGVVQRPRRRFRSAVNRTKLCPTCNKIITRRPAPNLMLNKISKSMYGLGPGPSRVEVEGNERGPPKDMWHDIFHVETDGSAPKPIDTEEMGRQRREEVLQIRLELEESLKHYHQDIETTVARINGLHVLISLARDEVGEMRRRWGIGEDR